MNLHRGMQRLNERVRAFQVRVEMCESANISQDFFSLAMGPSVHVRSYSECIRSLLDNGEF